MKTVATSPDTKVLSVVERDFTVRDGRRIARVAGVLFIVATLAGILSTLFLGPINSANYLSNIFANVNSILIGTVLGLVNAGACASIAISLYQVLRKYSQGLALGSVGFRLIEGVLYIVGMTAVVSLLKLGQTFVLAGSPQSSYFQTLGDLLLSQYRWVSFGAAPLAFGIGALMYYFIFYQTKLVPRWLSDWGIVGAALCIVSSLLLILGLIGPFSTIQVLLNLAIGVQEMAFAAWLIVKGFRSADGLI